MKLFQLSLVNLWLPLLQDNFNNILGVDRDEVYCFVNRVRVCGARLIILTSVQI